MPDIYFTQAVRQGLGEAMRTDERVIVFGEDVDRSTMATTTGLIDEFGSERVMNTPISEATFVGAGLGASTAGLRPVVDLMFSSFVYVAMDQLANQAGRLRYMSGGQLEAPVTYLMGTGPAGSAAAQHSENPHSMLMHISGIKVVFPSTPGDMKGLLLASIEDPNPVIVLIDLMLAGSKGPVPEGGERVPLGVADVKREGSDVTVVAVGSMVPLALKVAGGLADEGISVEVVDPRCLVPLDVETIAKSVRKTGRLVVVDPARQTCGLGGELIALACESCWEDMRAQPIRVTWPDVPMPFSPPLEGAVVVAADQVADAVRASFSGSGKAQTVAAAG